MTHFFSRFIITLSVFWWFNTTCLASGPDSSRSIPFLQKIKNPLQFKYKRLQGSVLPVCSFDPASGIEMGVMPVLAVSPKNDTTGSQFYRASSMVNHLTYSTNKWVNMKSDLQYYTSMGFCHKLLFQYLNAPDFFYGIGNDTLNHRPSSFNNENLRFSFETTKMIGKRFFLGLKIDFMSATISRERGNILTNDIDGEYGGDMLGTGPVIRYDSRNNVNYPGKGAYIETSALWFRKNNVFEYKFRFYNIDIRKYVTLFNDVIIAFQANASVSKGNIPFYRMPTIGGKFSLRGISNKFMYIDQNCWYTQAEIRKHITWRIGGVAFAGVGNNFKTWDADMYQNVKATYGLGARFQMIPRDKLNLRFDYAFGPHGDSGFYATVREVF